MPFPAVIKKNKILFITGTLGQGGAERQLFYIISSLKGLGYHVEILNVTKSGFWERKLKDLAIPVIWVGKSHFRIIRMIMILFQSLRFHPDIIFSQHFPTNIYAYFAGLFLNKPVIGSVRSNLTDEISDAGIWGKYCFRFPKVLAVNSHAAMNIAMKMGRKEKGLFYLPNVVDTDHYKPINHIRTSGPLRVIFVGTLWGPKRVDKIIKIAKLCLDQNINIHFYLYGHGILKDDLHKQATLLNVINTNLFFMGAIQDPQDVYHQADLLLLTSDREGMPNVVLEAMASGIAVISTSVGDVKTIIENSVNGFVVDAPNEIEKIVEHLKYLSENRNLLHSMGIANRNKICKDFSIDNLPTIIGNLLEKVN